ncbi:MAG TPA: cysteine--tRNA ligase [Chloroflexi bacterium]|nr:cysteine--tRNA ligase [Chloroflexota bacterium]HAL25661.1 cysteine--tRNA ligase [Chloroflexota bacterium]
MTIQLFNSATRTVEPFTPLKRGEVGVYNCGPTVYDYQHIGNLYSYLTADIARRTFEYFGLRVHQVMNITDVGHLVGDADTGGLDKMTVGAQREQLDPLAMAERYTAQFMVDRWKLHILDPQVVAKATQHIPEMIALIGRLIAKGNAYIAADGVYFDTKTFPGYGTRLNPEPPDQREAGARVEVNPNKRNAFDFALWRAAKPGDLQQWDSPWGRGNPGWHIECSAMSMKYLGETFDLHSGGEDHLFPHHECEIAQSEAATGKRFVNYWMHTHFLRMDSAKMAKSAKSADGFFRLDDLIARGHDPLAFRMLALGVSYRKGLDFAWEALGEAERRLGSWRTQVREATQAGGTPTMPAHDDPIRVAFAEAIGDDLNSPRALAQAEAALKLVNSTDDGSRARGLGLLFDMDRVLALGLEASASASDDLAGDDKRLFDERLAARKAGDYKRSDELRVALEARGIKVKDTKDGARWERIKEGSAR